MQYCHFYLYHRSKSFSFEFGVNKLCELADKVENDIHRKYPLWPFRKELSSFKACCEHTCRVTLFSVLRAKFQPQWIVSRLLLLYLWGKDRPFQATKHLCFAHSLLLGQTLPDLFCIEVEEFRAAVLHSQTLLGYLSGRGERRYFQAGYF